TPLCWQGGPILTGRRSSSHLGTLRVYPQDPLANQPSQNPLRRFLGAGSRLSLGADTRRAACFARTRIQHVPSSFQQSLPQGEERSTLADAARIIVIQKKIRLEVSRSFRDILGQRDSQVARVAHQQQSGHRAEHVAQPRKPVLFFLSRKF